MALHLIRLQGELKSLIREIESNPNVLGSEVFARAKLMADSPLVEWTEYFLECVARMRAYQRGFFSSKPNTPQRKTYYENSVVAEQMIDDALRQMEYIPGRVPDPADGLFANSDDTEG